MMIRSKYLMFLFLVALSACFSKPDEIDFFLPKEFKGGCVIMYNCKDGISPIQNNGVKQIIVPPSGVVKLKEQITYGQIKYRYFITAGKVHFELKVFQSFQHPTSDSFYVGPGTVVTVGSLDSSLKNTERQSAYTFFVHKLGDTIPFNYNDSWILDTLNRQEQINKRFNN